MAEDSKQLVDELQARPASEAAHLLEPVSPAIACDALAQLNPAFAQDILAELPDDTRNQIIAAASVEVARQWKTNQAFEAGTLGRLMEPKNICNVIVV